MKDSNVACDMTNLIVTEIPAYHYLYSFIIRGRVSNFHVFTTPSSAGVEKRLD
jgi:hypothetical protein